MCRGSGGGMYLKDRKLLANKQAPIESVLIKDGRPVDVSIVIVNWNTKDLLRQCIRSVYAESPSIRCEVIVVDNGSTDGSIEMVRQEFILVNLLVQSDNLGFAAANNIGIAAATGRYVLLLNSDTVVLDRAIEKTIDYADAHPGVAVIGCRALNPDYSLQNTCFMFPSILNLVLFSAYLYRLFPKSRFFGRELMTWWLRDDPREVEVVTGCYMLVRKEAIDDVGLMDERFFMYYEETDWCLRFRAKGWKNQFTPDAEIIHIGGASTAKIGPQRARLKNRSFVRYVFKHWPKWKAIVGVFLFGLFHASRLAILVPKRLFLRNAHDQKLVESHWVGLKDIFMYNKHLAT
jgi:GT2 family glycosyltransferase